jgi:hypothetical protein
VLRVACQSLAMNGAMLWNSTQWAQGRVGTGVGLLLFTDPGVEGFSAIRDAAARTHAEARRSLTPVPPDVECVR